MTPRSIGTQGLQTPSPGLHYTELFLQLGEASANTKYASKKKKQNKTKQKEYS